MNKKISRNDVKGTFDKLMKVAEHSNAPTPDAEEYDALTPFNVLADKDGVKLDTFNELDGPYAGYTREQLLAELGVDGSDDTLVKGKVAVDAISGERMSVKNEITELVDSLQDINADSVREQLSTIARQNIMLLIPDTMAEEDADKLVTELEARVANLSKKEIQDMSNGQILDIIGSDIYAGISKYNQNPSKVAKQFLLDLKESLVETTKLVNTVDEMSTAMKFFEQIGINDVNEENAVEDPAYETRLHQYQASMRRYLERLQANEEMKDNHFVEAEIKTCTSKLTALEEALEFKPILNKAFTLKKKIRIDFKDQSGIEKLIENFIGKIHNDPTIMVSFPMPKNLPEKFATAKYLSFIWLSYIAMVEMRSKYNDLSKLSYLDYSDLAGIVEGTIKVKDDAPENDIVNARLLDLKKFAIEQGIERSDIIESHQFATIFTYLLAKAFKPGDLNDEHTKYVLGYVMNILANSLKPNFAAVTHRLFDQIKDAII